MEMFTYFSALVKINSSQTEGRILMEILKQNLEAKGYQVHIFNNKEEAVKFAKSINEKVMNAIK
jgi:uncharacterized lipoprotein YajG